MNKKEYNRWARTWGDNTFKSTIEWTRTIDEQQLEEIILWRVQ